jgi:hypothetical protein
MYLTFLERIVPATDAEFASICDWFTEGSDTLNLKETNALLTSWGDNSETPSVALCHAIAASTAPGKIYQRKNSRMSSLPNVV